MPAGAVLAIIWGAALLAMYVLNDTPEEKRPQAISDPSQPSQTSNPVESLSEKLDAEEVTKEVTKGITSVPFRDDSAQSRPSRMLFWPSNDRERSTVVAVSRIVDRSFAEVLGSIESSAVFEEIASAYARHSPAISELMISRSKLAAEFAKSMAERGQGEVWIVPHHSPTNSEEAKAKIAEFNKAKLGRTPDEYVAFQQFGKAPEGHFRAVLFRIAPGDSAEFDEASRMMRQARAAAAAEILPLLK